MVRIEIYFNGLYKNTEQFLLPSYTNISNWEYRTKARLKFVNRKIEELRIDLDFDAELVIYFTSRVICPAKEKKIVEVVTLLKAG